MENTQEMPVPAVKPPLPGAWNMFKQSVGFLKDNFRAVFGIFISPLIFMVVGTMLIRSLPVDDRGNAILSGATSGQLTAFIIGVIISIIGGVLAYIAAIGFIYFLLDKEKGVYSSVKEYYKKAAHIFWAFVWISILLSLSIFGGFALFIVPGIILSFYLLFSTYVLVDENKKGLTALTQSWNYVRGYAWSIFFKLLLFGLLLFPIYIVLIAVFAGLAYVSFGQELSIITISSIDIVVRFIQQIIIGPLGAIYLFLIYRNLKSVKSETVPDFVEKKRKNKLIAVSILGLLIIPLIVLSVVFTSLMAARQKAKDVSSPEQYIEIEEVYDYN